MVIKRRLKSESGFTLLEILIVICLIGILAAISTPGLRNWKQNADLNADMRRLYGVFQKARLEAVRRNGVCDIAFNQVVNGTLIDCVSFIDANGNNQFDNGETVIDMILFSDGITILSNDFDPAFFDRRGLIDSNGTLTLGASNGSQHSLVLNTRGRMLIR